jgi:aspartate dehydrogenase
MSKNKKIQIGIAGCGAIGRQVASFIEKELFAYAAVTALFDRESTKAQALKRRLGGKPVIMGLDGLARKVDLIIEAASQQCASQVFQKALCYKKNVMILSVGALIHDMALIKKGAAAGIQVYVPSGAICGVDGIGALSLGKIKKILLTTSKPPSGFLGAAYLKKKGIAVQALKKKKVIFQGTVAQAVKYFPQNINVAATLLLASAGSNVKVSIETDPTITRNVHKIEIQAREAHLKIEVHNVPSSVNPKTSALAILSTQYLLRKIFSSFKIGS